MGGFVLAAIDIHKVVFQAAVLDPADGEVAEQRFKASREALVAWIEGCDGELEAVAIEAMEFPRFRGQLIAGPSGLAARIDVDAVSPAVFA
jgi:hypothetical protein